MNEKSASPTGVGALTILTVLLVLTLALFAALTYSSARADLALSRVNAETVTAYYQADAKAERIAAEFEAGNEPSLVADLPMTPSQSLHIELTRAADGSTEILAWNTVPLEPDSDPSGNPLPVWDGVTPFPA